MVMHRKLFVEHDGLKSDLFCFASGVAEGSNLGPLLFILIYNDVIDDVNCKLYINAEDLKISSIINSTLDCVQLQNYKNILVLCFKTNRLDLNTDKCKKITCRRKHQHINFYYNVEG
ncbi:MAG: hypothetical protein GAK29_04623 [Acinetobacter bereziniae]|uniref:Reverse transcriptase domain-containing protein n=1 Tax=Acinetobacter bereziniae TaxID=106648 RepID=A0A833UMP9_ACIBZ|nr:MAG: hypothetical protein GAK29_04623 [Acinetobacter bereziniae]